MSDLGRAGVLRSLFLHQLRFAAAGLVAVALLGAVVASVFEHALGASAELPIFFGLPATGLSATEDVARLSATDAAFSTIAYVTAALSLLSAGIAWLTLERKAV